MPRLKEQEEKYRESIRNNVTHRLWGMIGARSHGTLLLHGSSMSTAVALAQFRKFRRGEGMCYLLVVLNYGIALCMLPWPASLPSIYNNIRHRSGQHDTLIHLSLSHCGIPRATRDKEGGKGSGQERSPVVHSRQRNCLLVVTALN